jgi:hypothetical protein
MTVQESAGSTTAPIFGITDASISMIRVQLTDNSGFSVSCRSLDLSSSLFPIFLTFLHFLKAGVIALIRSSVTINQSCFERSAAQFVVFIANDANFAVSKNFVDAFDSQQCQATGPRLFVEDTGSGCFLGSSMCEGTCLILADQDSCRALEVPTFSPVTTAPVSSPTLLPTLSPVFPASFSPTKVQGSLPTAYPFPEPPMATLSPVSGPASLLPILSPAMFPTPLNTLDPTLSPVNFFPTRDPTYAPINLPTTAFPTPHIPFETSSPSLRPISQPTVTPFFEPTLSPAPTGGPTTSSKPTISLAPTSVANGSKKGTNKKGKGNKKSKGSAQNTSRKSKKGMLNKMADTGFSGSSSNKGKGQAVTQVPTSSSPVKETSSTINKNKDKKGSKGQSHLTRGWKVRADNGSADFEAAGNSTDTGPLQIGDVAGVYAPRIGVDMRVVDNSIPVDVVGIRNSESTGIKQGEQHNQGRDLGVVGVDANGIDVVLDQHEEVLLEESIVRATSAVVDGDGMGIDVVVEQVQDGPVDAETETSTVDLGGMGIDVRLGDGSRQRRGLRDFILDRR